MTRAPACFFVVLAAVPLLLPSAGLAESAPRTSDVAPPSVVGWLAQPSGTAWVARGAGQPWQPALANQPLQGGEIVATAPDGETAIGVMATRTILGPSTELAIDHLGAGGFSATETVGEIALDLSALPQGAQVAIATPRGTVEIAEPGRYEIAAGAATQPTTVTAIGGPASIESGVSVETVHPGQAAILSNGPNDTISVAITAAAPDPLLQLVIARQPPHPLVTPPPEVATMTGGRDLAAYGTWSDVPTYGTIWFPDVPAGWAPYRDGRWVAMAPWGWTWVDAEPWGFAPFHYGRWVRLGPRWGWVPVAHGIRIFAGVPAYAPALVQFFAEGSIGGLGITISAGALSAGLVGWVPLGPGEVYRPPFAASPTYIRRVNVYNVRNVNRININRAVNNRITIDHFIDHRALTAVPSAVLAHGQPVRPFYRRLPADTLTAFRSLPDGPPPYWGSHAAWAKTRQRVPAPAHQLLRVVRPAPAMGAHPRVTQPARRPEQTVGGYRPLPPSIRLRREPSRMAFGRPSAPPRPPPEAHRRVPTATNRVLASARRSEPAGRRVDSSRFAHVPRRGPARQTFVPRPRPRRRVQHDRPASVHTRVRTEPQSQHQAHWVRVEPHHG